jgi:hypothetical protein
MLRVLLAGGKPLIPEHDNLVKTMYYDNVDADASRQREKKR